MAARPRAGGIDPRELLDQSGLPRLAEALTKLHHPQPDDPVDLLLDGNHPAVKRLVMEEMVAHQLGMLAKRAGQKALSAPRLEGERLTARLLESLPFRLTGAQQRVIGEIRADLCRDHPMLRLIQGDVGSGKTLVAAAAALVAMETGYQVALMAPTELLAEQHLNNFRRWLAPWASTCTGWPAAWAPRRAGKPWPPWPTAAPPWWWAPTPCSRTRWRSSGWG